MATTILQHLKLVLSKMSVSLLCSPSGPTRGNEETSSTIVIDSNSPSDSTRVGEIPTVAIIGSALGGVVIILILLVTVVVFCLIWRKKENKEQAQPPPHPSAESGTVVGNNPVYAGTCIVLWYFYCVH